MDKEYFKNHLNQYLLLLAFVVDVCVVILIFFKTNVLLAGIQRLLSILSPFIYGAVIAYILHFPCTWIEQRLAWLSKRLHLKERPGTLRFISILISLVLMYAVIILLLLAVLPELISSIGRIAQSLPDLITRLQDYLDKLVQGDTSQGVVSGLDSSLQTVSGHLQSYLQDTLLPTMESLVTRVTSSFTDLLSVVTNFGLGSIVASYLLGGWERFIAQARMIVYALFPRKAADWIRDEVHFSDQVFSGFIIGKIIDSAIIGVLCFIFCEITSMPYSMLVSVIVGVTNIIPFFGPYLGAIPSAVLIFTISPTMCVVFVVFIIILQQFDGNVLGPSILGDRLGISGIWILFSILFFGSVWGFIGMLIGVPVFAILYDLFSRIVAFCLRKRGETAMLKEYRVRFTPPLKEPKEPPLERLKKRMNKKEAKIK